MHFTNNALSVILYYYGDALSSRLENIVSGTAEGAIVAATVLISAGAAAAGIFIIKKGAEARIKKETENEQQES